MNQCTLNNLNIFDGVITFPRIGVWHADLSVSTGIDPSGSATLVLGSQTWVGSYSLQSGLDLLNRQRVRVVGGAGKISNQVLAKSYNAIQARIPLQDAIQDSGEAISPVCDPTVLSIPLRGWVRFQTSGSFALRAILSAIPNNPSWRVVSDGTIWVGYETWPVVTLNDTGYLHSDPASATILIGSFDPDISPGEVLHVAIPNQPIQDLKVSSIVHTIEDGKIRSLIRYENY